MKKYLLFLAIVLFPLFSNAQVQWYASSGPTTEVIDLNVCGDTTFSIYIYNPTTTTLLNNLIDIDLPAGVEYLPASVLETTTSTGVKNVVESNISDLNRPYFSFDSIPANDWVSFTYRVHTQCGIGGNSISIPITLSYNGGTASPFGLNAVNIDKATINIVSATNQNFTGGIGTSYQQTVTLRNAGLGYLDSLTSDLEVRVLLDGTSCLSISNPDKGTLSGDTLMLPKSLFATIGDGDGKWENNEDIQITYTVTVNCCTNLSRNIQANWGCDGNICETTSSFPSSVIIPNTIPNVVATMPVVDDQFCYDGTNGIGTGTPVVNQMRLINTGTGAATNFNFIMYSNRPGSSTGDNYYDTTVAWTVRNSNGDSVGITTNPRQIAVRSYFGVNGSCGVGNGISQVRWDIGGIVINAGDTLYVDVPTYVSNFDISCRTGCGNTNWSPYVYNTSFFYQGPCATTSYSSTRVHLVQRSHVFYQYIAEMPTDLKDLETFDLKIDYSRMYTTGLLSNGKSLLSIPLTGTDLTYNGGATVPQSGNISVDSTLPAFVSNDTLWIEFPTGRGGVSGVVTIPMQAHCGAGGTHTLNMQHYSTYDTTRSCAGTHRSYCLNKTYVLHCPNPCPTGGATPIDFSLTRTSLGLGDDNDNGQPSGAIDSSKIAWNHAVNGDTLQGLWNIKVHPNVEPANPNVGLDFPFTFIEFDLGTPSGGNNTATTALTAMPNAEVIVYDSGSVVANAPCFVTPIVIGQIATYDLSSCKSSWKGGDSIIVRADYVANASLENGGYKDFITDNDVYSSYTATANNTYATVDSINGQRHTCDHWNSYMLIYNIYSSPYVAANQSINGCGNSLTMSLRRYLEAQSGDSRFPFEARYLEVIDEYNVRFTDAFTLRPGSAKLGSTTIPDSLISTNGNYFHFTNLKSLYVDYGGPLAMDDEAQSTSLTFSVDPTCDAVPGASYGIRFNAAVAGNGINVPTSFNPAIDIPGTAGDSSSAPSVVYNAPIPFTTGGGTIALFNDSASWNVVLNNGSNSIDAPDTWMYIENLSGGNLTNFEVLLNGTISVQKQLSGFYHLGTNIRSSSTPFEIRGNLTTCDTVKLLLHSGYGCTGYPSAFDTSACYETDTLIAYSYPTGTDANFQVNWNGGNNTVAFCAPFDVELTLNSTQLGDISKLDNFWLIPFGFNLDQPNIQIEYPIGTGYRTPSDPNTISVLGQLMTIDYNLLDDSLANGLSGSYDTTTKALKIKVPFNTSCGASSGDQITVIYNSRSACGDFLPTITKESPPIVFTQAAIPGYTTTPIGRMDTIGDCAANSTFNFYVDLAINQVSQQTQVGDSIFVVVPPGVTYNMYSSASSGQLNQPTVGPFGPVDVGNGQLRYSWPMTPNLTTGDSIKFYFDVNFDYSSFQGCNQAFSDFVITTGSGSQVVCNNDTCSVLSINGRGTKGLELDLPKLAASMFNTVCGVSGEGVYRVITDLDICNTSGSDVGANTQTTVEFYSDLDESFSFTAGDNFLKDTVITSSIPANSCLTLTGLELILPDSFSITRPILSVIRRVPNAPNQEQCVCDTLTTGSFICAAVLPVNIIDFSGRRISNGTNELTWKVSEEKDILAYELFKSIDQRNWSLVGSIGSQNTGNQIRTIRMLDEEPGSSTYYRLRIVGQDGDKTTHHKIVHINSMSVEDGVVMVYPNPTSGELNFVYDLDQNFTDHFLQLEIVDLSGRILQSSTASMSTSNNRAVLSTETLAAGTYILRYRDVDNGESGFVKFTKQ